DPAVWPVPSEEKAYWERLKGRLAYFQLQEPITIELTDTKPAVPEVVAAAILARVRGGLSWMSLNRVRGARIDDRHRHSVLALLITLGVIEPALHWQDRHPYIPASTSLIDDLAAELSRTASRQWTRPTLELMNRRLAEQPELGWLQRTEAQELLDALTTNTSI